MASASSLETYTSSGGSLGNNAPTETIEIDPEVAAGLFWMEGDVVSSSGWDITSKSAWLTTRVTIVRSK
jgi:hypothetical protein